MFEKFKNHLEKNFAFLEKKKLLLAVSGGIDSMVMVSLFKDLEYDISLAHCNSNLRGKESDGDAAFVKRFASGNNIQLFETSFDTAQYVKDTKASVQVAARQLRYLYFAELLQKHDLDYLLTAHHADDNIETFLINFSRGTGIAGLTGIPQQNEKIARPLLVFSREEIENYGKLNRIEWREDSSNSSEKYIRNKIRHSIIPHLKEINTNFINSFNQTIENLQQSQSMIEDASILIYKQVVIEKEHKLIFKIFDLTKLLNYKAYLHHWLKDFGFTAWEDIYALPYAQSGKRVFSNEFVLFKDREILILEKLQSSENIKFEIFENSSEVRNPINLRFETVQEIDQPHQNCIFVDADKINYPLTLRKWEEGDHFYPFGLKGSKKVSKFFKDEKISVSDKSDIWMLTSANIIIWIIGHRADDRFKVTSETSRILKISYRP